MPHRCVRCGKIYDDGANEILAGCSCGSKLFLFVKKTDLEKAEELTSSLSPEDKKQIEKDVFDIIGLKEEPDRPVILDLESIKISAPGKFELDLVNLFNKKNPLVYKLEEGKYVIDLAETFLRQKDKKE